MIKSNLHQNKNEERERIIENAHNEPIYALLTVNKSQIASGSDSFIELWDLQPENAYKV